MIKSEKVLSFDQVKNDIKNDSTNILNERVYEKANAFYENLNSDRDILNM